MRHQLTAAALVVMLAGCSGSDAPFGAVQDDDFDDARYTDDYVSMRLDVEDMKRLGARNTCADTDVPAPSNRSACIRLSLFVRNHTPFALTATVDSDYPRLNDKQAPVAEWKVSYDKSEREETGRTIQLTADQAGWIFSYLWFDHSGKPTLPVYEAAVSYDSPDGPEGMQKSEVWFQDNLQCWYYWEQRACDDYEY